MAIDLATKYANEVDELLKSEPKTQLFTNENYDFTGAHTVKVYKVTSVELNDYKRSLEDGEEIISRYGQIQDLSATTQEMTLSQDKSFIFNIDKMDADETNQALAGGTALARELREVVIPTREKYIYSVMTEKAGTKPEAKELSESTIYDEILDATEIMDEAEVPENGRVLVVTPRVYKMIKKFLTETAQNSVDAEARNLGIVAYLDGMAVVKVPKNYLPDGFGFMIAHPSATTTPAKLMEAGCYDGAPYSSGTVVNGRFVYDAFVLDNKKMGIYYQQIKEAE
jgi:hypothetical protein